LEDAEAVVGLVSFAAVFWAGVFCAIAGAAMKARAARVAKMVRMGCSPGRRE
jgi:hypothetical protein